MQFKNFRYKISLTYLQKKRTKLAFKVKNKRTLSDKKYN